MNKVSRPSKNSRPTTPNQAAIQAAYYWTWREMVSSGSPLALFHDLFAVFVPPIPSGLEVFALGGDMTLLNEQHVPFCELEFTNRRDQVRLKREEEFRHHLEDCPDCTNRYIRIQNAFRRWFRAKSTTADRAWRRFQAAKAGGESLEPREV